MLMIGESGGLTKIMSLLLGLCCRSWVPVVLLLLTGISSTLARHVAPDPRDDHRSSTTYRPVILVHGVLTGTSTLNDLVKLIEEVTEKDSVDMVGEFQIEKSFTTFT